MNVTPKSAAPDNIPPGAVLIQGDRTTLHLSLWFEDADGTMRCLSMTARGLRCELEFTEPAWFVPPASSPQVIGDLCDAAERFWRQNEKRGIPFFWDLRGVHLLPDKTLLLDGTGGLTCATLILLLFEHINAPLLCREQWERAPDKRRRREDEQTWQRISPPSRSASSDRAHTNPPSLTIHRFRPEEVAVASGLPERPVGYCEATHASQLLLSLLPS